MASVFDGKFMRHAYRRITAAQLATALNPTSAFQAEILSMGARFLFLDNTMDKELSILLVAPGADATVVANRKLFIEIGPNRVMNYDFLPAIGMNFDPGTQIWLHSTDGVAPSTGTFKLSAWA